MVSAVQLYYARMNGGVYALRARPSKMRNISMIVAVVIIVIVRIIE